MTHPLSPQQCSLDILAEPANALAIPLSHYHAAHEDLDGPDTLKGHFALACRLIQSQCTPELVLRDGIGVVDLVAEDNERYIRELLHSEESVELGFRLGESLVILSVDEEDNTANFGDYTWSEVNKWQGQIFYNSRARGGELVRDLQGQML